MDHEYDFPDSDSRPIAYVRAVSFADLPKSIQSQISETSKLYAVHDEEGQRLAVVPDRKLAFALARQNDFSPVSVN